MFHVREAGIHQHKANQYSNNLGKQKMSKFKKLHLFSAEITKNILRKIDTCTIIILLIAFSAHQKAFAIFGDGETPLIEYYNFGRSQTGVASIVGIKRFSHFQGTANLIECDNADLQGMILLTAAHVVRDADLKNFYIRLVDENNQEVIVKAAEVSLHNNQDIALIKLKQSVDTSRFRPLRINLTPGDLKNQQVSVFGMTSAFGKINSNCALAEPMGKATRRGMITTIVHHNKDNGQLNDQYHNPAGFIEIHRREETKISAEGVALIAEANEKFKPQIEEFKQKKATATKAELATLREALDPLTELRDKVEFDSQYKEVVRRGFSVTISGKDSIKTVLAAQTADAELDVADLDVDKITGAWNEFIQPLNTEGVEKSFNDGPYRVEFHKPLGPLRGITYHGDSGGAVVKDNAIVGICRAGYDFNFNIPKETFFEIQQSETPEQYFQRAEAFFADKSGNILKEKSCNKFFLALAPYKDWIEETLSRMAGITTTVTSCSESSSSSSSAALEGEK